MYDRISDTLNVYFHSQGLTGLCLIGEPMVGLKEFGLRGELPVAPMAPLNKGSFCAPPREAARGIPNPVKL